MLLKNHPTSTSPQKNTVSPTSLSLRSHHPRLSHISWGDLWQPSPKQRVINAVRTGSRELGFRQHRHETFDDLAMLHRAAMGTATVATMLGNGGAREL